MTGSLFVALDAVHAVVWAYNESRYTTEALRRAHETLHAALETTERRSEFLEALAAEREAGRIPEEAHRRILVAAARLMHSQVDFVEECQRILGNGREE